MQRRLIGDAAAVSDQILCTTHAPRVAAFFPADSAQILARKASPNAPCEGALEGRPLAPKSMVKEPNPLVQLYTDHRTPLIEALMFQRVLVPEGRVDYEWLRLMLDVSETGCRPISEVEGTVPPFGSVIGVVPTPTSAVQITFDRLRQLHDHVGVLQVRAYPITDTKLADLKSRHSDLAAKLDECTCGQEFCLDGYIYVCAEGPSGRCQLFASDWQCNG